MKAAYAVVEDLNARHGVEKNKTLPPFYKDMPPPPEDKNSAYIYWHSGLREFIAAHRLRIAYEGVRSDVVVAVHPEVK